MKKEKSCGCIILDREKGEVLLVYEKRRNFWGFPKGHVEGKETELETATREVREEVGMEVNIDESKRYEMNYYIKDCDVDKTTVLYVASLKNPADRAITMQESEIENAGWFSYADALQTLTFENSRATLQEALNDIKA